MSTQELKEIEASIETAKFSIELGKSLERLMANRDFRQVILSGYLEKEAVRLVHLKATRDAQFAEMQKDILTKLDSIGCLQQYLFGIQDSVEMALKTIEAAESTIDEINSQG